MNVFLLMKQVKINFFHLVGIATAIQSSTAVTENANAILAVGLHSPGTYSKKQIDFNILH